MASKKMPSNGGISYALTPRTIIHRQMARQLLLMALSPSQIKHVPYRLGGITLFTALSVEEEYKTPNRYSNQVRGTGDLLDDDGLELDEMVMSIETKRGLGQTEAYELDAIYQDTGRDQDEDWDKNVVISFLNSCKPESSNPLTMDVLQSDQPLLDHKESISRPRAISALPTFQSESEPSSTSPVLDHACPEFNLSDKLALDAMAPIDTVSHFKIAVPSTPQPVSKMPLSQEKLPFKERRYLEELPKATKLPRLHIRRWICREDAKEVAEEAVHEAKKDADGRIVLFVDGSFHDDRRAGWSCWGAAVVRKSPCISGGSSELPLPSASRTWGYQQKSSMSENTPGCANSNDAEILAITLGVKCAIPLVKCILQKRKAADAMESNSSAKQLTSKRIVVQIFTDSVTSLTKIHEANRGHQIQRNKKHQHDFTEFSRAAHELHELGGEDERNVEIELHWVPGHSGVSGNDEAHLLAVKEKNKLIKQVSKEVKEKQKANDMKPIQPKIGKQTESTMEVKKTLIEKRPEEKILTKGQQKKKLKKERRRQEQLAEEERRMAQEPEEQERFRKEAEQKRKELIEKRKAICLENRKMKKQLKKEKKRLMREEEEKRKALETKLEQKGREENKQTANREEKIMTRSMTMREAEERKAELEIEQKTLMTIMMMDENIKSVNVTQFRKYTNKAWCLWQMAVFLVLMGVLRLYAALLV